MKTRIALLFWILPFVGCTHANVTSNARRPADYYDDRTPKFSESQKLTFDKLLAQVRNGKIADTLEQLHKTFPEYLNFYALMYDSGSAQKGSFLQPRAIVYGPDAHFIFTFNGDPSQVGGNALETMTFNDRTSMFELREIIFKNERADSHHSNILDEEVEFETDQLIVSKTNPESCMECHGMRVTGPIWDNYFIWPGAYGSNDDILFDSAEAGNDHQSHGGGDPKYLNDLTYPRSQGRAFNLKDGVIDKEKEGFEAFEKLRSTDPRYRWLTPHKKFYHNPKGPTDDLMIAENSYLTTAFSPLREQQLNQAIEKLDLEKKWADIVWPPFNYPDYGAFNQPGTPPPSDTFKEIDYPEFDLDQYAALYEKAFGPKRMAALTKKVGPLKDFIAGVLNREFDMDFHKIKRLEKTFGHRSLTLTPGYPSHVTRMTVHEQQPSKISQATYVALKHRSLYREEKLGFEIEVFDMAKKAALAYLLRGDNIFLEDYDINRDAVTQERVLSFTGTSIDGELHKMTQPRQ